MRVIKMSLSERKTSHRDKRHKHIRKRISGTKDRPRLIVFRSNKHMYAQLIDDVEQRTLMGVSTLSKEMQSNKKSTKVESAKVLGKRLAEMAKEKKITRVVFDRAGYMYHGRVKALADGAREGGLDF
jgi:large subunit ribosomal protein L18